MKECVGCCKKNAQTLVGVGGKGGKKKRRNERKKRRSDEGEKVGNERMKNEGMSRGFF